MFGGVAHESTEEGDEWAGKINNGNDHLLKACIIPLLFPRVLYIVMTLPL